MRKKCRKRINEKRNEISVRYMKIGKSYIKRTRMKKRNFLEETPSFANNRTKFEKNVPEIPTYRRIERGFKKRVHM